MGWNIFHRPVPNFSVGVHCIVIFLVRMVLLFMVINFLGKAGRRLLRKEARPGRRSLNRGMKSVTDFMSVWIPVRLMCPGIILRIGKWTCAAAAAIFPANADPFNHAAKSHQFWLMYGWTEILIFGTIFLYVWNHGGWAFGVTYVTKLKHSLALLFKGDQNPFAFLGHLLHGRQRTTKKRRISGLIRRRGRSRSRSRARDTTSSSSSSSTSSDYEETVLPGPIPED